MTSLSTWWSWSLVVLVVILAQETTAQYHSLFPDLRGDYCRKKSPDRCCDGRLDDCSVPILGTLCYCDQFCVRDFNSDCCPDYFDVCRGSSPLILPCRHNGNIYHNGQSVKVNCNECTCHNGNFTCTTHDCLIDETVMGRINAPGRHSWRAANYTEFWGRTTSDGFIYRMGTKNTDRMLARMYPILLVYDKTRIPRFFDARTQWGSLVSGIRDQGWCGASWAFSTLSVAEDRFAIESIGEERVRLSTQNLISCDVRGQQGCKGGHLDRAWNYLRRFGVVNEECFPYQSGHTSQKGSCKVPRGANLLTQRCHVTRNNRKELYKMEPPYRVSSKEEDIMYEIMENGPVQATMTVHDDFFMYKSGIYTFTGIRNPERTALHSVRIVGWGETSVGRRRMKYWVVANSWGREWGENGYFKIKRGTNESNIENFIITARARLIRNHGAQTYRTNRRADRHHKRSHHHKKHHELNSV
ncbi:putative peptidase C1-like protein F26E4.3 [Oratosquilla oratoria]|uniref:putative peptidase C1-like protein F26E4.3 n=1 Tax=Oratosquilla oratoria TaxID=337810 RepID=UPI003F765F0F